MTYGLKSILLPDPYKLVQQIINQDDAQSSNEGASTQFEFSSSSSSKAEKLFLRFENAIRENRSIAPSWPVAGPLNYGMTLSEMQTEIEQSFTVLAQKGRLITETQFSQAFSREDYYPSEGRGSSNLTRIWGAAFLNRNLPKNSKLRAVDPLLVIDDNTTTLKVEVWLGNYPYLSVVHDAHILSPKIIGQPCAWDYRFSSELDLIRYRDFKDQGNILKEDNGLGWIVDTELKSFDPPPLDKTSQLLLSYLGKRFQVLAGEKAGITHQSFQIPINIK